MASIRENTPKSGGKTWSVLYRLGTKQPSTTFSTLDAAKNSRSWSIFLAPIGL